MCRNVLYVLEYWGELEGLGHGKGVHVRPRQCKVWCDPASYHTQAPSPLQICGSPWNQMLVSTEIQNASRQMYFGAFSNLGNINVQITTFHCLTQRGTMKCKAKMIYSKQDFKVGTPILPAIHTNLLLNPQRQINQNKERFQKGKNRK